LDHLVEQLLLKEEVLDEETAFTLEKIWNNKKIKKYYKEYQSELHLPCNIPFFWSMAKKVALDDYVPSREEMLKCRLLTFGITEIRCVINNIQIDIIDVGGRRDERKKNGFIVLII